jgi:hypothetical protein
MKLSTTKVLLFCVSISDAFLPPSKTSQSSATNVYSSAVDDARTMQKEALLELLGRTRDGRVDPVLADPETKEPLLVSVPGTLLGGQGSPPRVTYTLKSSTNTYGGSSDTFLNLLEPSIPTTTEKNKENSESFVNLAVKSLAPFIPPPLRSALATAGADMGSDYVPMRDLFTSPAVSFAYERGWRQGFAQAGFPGPDVEYQMAKDYFAPAVVDSSTVVDMSCATGMYSLTSFFAFLETLPSLIILCFSFDYRSLHS